MSSTVSCGDVVRSVLDLPGEREPLGDVAVGHAARPAPERLARPLDEHLVLREPGAGDAADPGIWGE